MKRNQKIIDHLMNLIDEHDRHNWCPGLPCACSGGVNCTGNERIKRHGASPITYDEWLDWKSRHDQIEISYNGEMVYKTAEQIIAVLKENGSLHWQINDLKFYVQVLERRITIL